MANLSRGITFSQTNKSVTPDKLHALIDTAIAAADAFQGTPTLYNLGMAELTTVRAVHVAAVPASPATNDVAVGSDHKLDYYTGSAWADLSREYMSLVNNSGITLATGNPVVADPSSAANCIIWTTSGVCYEPLGVSMEVTAPAGTAKIQVRGVALVRVNNPLFATVGSFLRIAAAGATAMSTTTSGLSDVAAQIVQVNNDDPLSGFCLAALAR